MIEIGWGREAGAFREVFANLLMPDGGKEQLKWIGELQRRSASPEPPAGSGMPSTPSTYAPRRRK